MSDLVILEERLDSFPHQYRVRLSLDLVQKVDKEENHSFNLNWNFHLAKEYDHYLLCQHPYLRRVDPDPHRELLGIVHKPKEVHQILKKNAEQYARKLQAQLLELLDFQPVIQVSSKQIFSKQIAFVGVLVTDDLFQKVKQRSTGIYVPAELKNIWHPANIERHFYSSKIDDHYLLWKQNVHYDEDYLFFEYYFGLVHQSEEVQQRLEAKARQYAHELQTELLHKFNLPSDFQKRITPYPGWDQDHPELVSKR